ncbi:MAG: SDR family oxidoreductase, partial [bacterium]|nr:SDR family oxidoreductase [bacterium]
MEEKIIVIGGTGMLGLPVAQKLKADGFQVTIMTTDPDRAKARIGSDFTLVKGDVTDIESLKPAIEGQDFVFLNLNSKLDPDLYQKIEIEGTANAA